MPAYRIFIQARMNSRRLPGKMLAPLAGKPVIAHVTDRLADAGLRDQIVILTSSEASDTPLALYATHELRLPVFRGELDNVARRFQMALIDHPAPWFIRISGDSPLIDGSLVAWMGKQIDDTCDLVSNVWRRSFPPGQSVECIRSGFFAAIDTMALSADQQQHVTPCLYDNPDCRIKRVTCNDATAASERQVLDTLEDYFRLEHMLANQPRPTYTHLARVEA
jgi:spore coat polysaccharide biosynthesis protein SpsF